MRTEHGSRSRRGRTLSLLLVLVLALVGCAAGAEEEERLALPPELAESLAARADAVADRMAAGDACAASAEADELVRETTIAVEGGDVPPPLGRELLAGAQELAGSIECPAEAAEPEEPPAAQPAEVQTLSLGEAGEVEFRFLGDGLELVQVRPAPGWRHSVSADADELDVGFERGDREVSVAIDAEGGGRFALDLYYEAGRGSGNHTLGLGQAGEVAVEVQGRTLRLLHTGLGPGWQTVKEDQGEKVELEARHENGSELKLVIELDD